jgi:hypothetical protein
MIVAKRSAAGGIVASLLFALSPIMLTYGSEARGYAPMILAALTMLLLAMRSVECGTARFAPWWLALVSLLGMLSHMTMGAPVALITLWVYLDRRRTEGPKQGLRTTARTMGPAAVVAAAVPILVIIAGMMSPSGMRVGGYVPFSWEDLFRALGDLSAWTFGFTMVPAELPLGAVALMTALVAVRPPKWLGTRSLLYPILILGVPLAIAVVHSGNVGFARYFLCSAIGLLLLASEWIARELEKSSSRRAGTVAVLGTILLTSLWEDSLLIRLDRGHPDEIVRLMRQRSLEGSRVALETPRLEAVTKVAAIQAAYRVNLVRGCAQADFVISSEPRHLASSGPLARCGVTMRPVGSGSGTALSGDRWILYAANRGPPLNIASR